MVGIFPGGGGTTPPQFGLYGLDGTWPIDGRTLDFGVSQHTQAPLEDNLAYWRACLGCWA